jgi:hypothetical protein
LLNETLYPNIGLAVFGSSGLVDGFYGKGMGAGKTGLHGAGFSWRYKCSD